jgi:hypothetical protein
MKPFKVRIFHSENINLETGNLSASGKVDIQRCNIETAVRLVKERMPISRKIIIEQVD